MSQMKRNSQNVTNDSTESEIDFETSCGLGNWRPQWMQKFATPKYFVINFSVVAILQGAYFTYLIGCISTLEKRFAFESKMSGFILIADNLSQMVISPIVGYLGSKYNRSHLMAVGELIVALSCIISAFPYFIYGPGTHILSNTNTVSNITQYEVCSSDHLDPECQNDDHSTVYLAVAFLWFASFANGMGYTAFYTIGLPYIDDNVGKKNSPLYLSAISTLRLCGPTFGFLLGSICLAWYEDPTFDPHIDRNDPRWIGAWWIGFLVLGISILIFTLPMFCFPKRFKGTHNEEEVEADTTAVTSVFRDPDEVNALEMSTSKTQVKIPRVEEVRVTLRRLAKNPILIFHAVGGIFRIFGYLGYYIFKPKYMEMQYRQSASGASFFTGSTSIATMAIGIMGGGLLIRYFKPKPRVLVSCMFVVEIIASFSILSAMFFGCPTPIFPNTHMMDGKMILNDVTNQCNTNCECSTRVYQPICASDNVSTYFSPCYAGCKTVDRTTDPISFSDCGCIGSEVNTFVNSSTFGGSANTGYCPTDCSNFPIYIILLSFGSMVSSTARTGNTLITLRCVDPKDKSFAMGIIGSFFAVFAFIPYPLIFGAITDSACLVWEEFCGKTGNCWLYDIDKFRVYLHGAAFAFMLIGSFFDIGIIILANRIKNLYDDEEEVDDNDKQNRIQLLDKNNDRINEFIRETNDTNVDTNTRNGRTGELEDS